MAMVTLGVPPEQPAFDTQHVNEDLRKDDVFNEAQASRLVTAIRSATSNFVTKNDLELGLARQANKMLLRFLAILLTVMTALIGIITWLYPPS